MPGIKQYKLTSTRAVNLSSWLEKLKEFELDNLFETRILGRGYEYVNSIQIINITNELTAKSMGANAYELILEFDDQSIYGSCTCPYDGPCKHLAGLLIHRINMNKKTN